MKKRVLIGCLVGFMAAIAFAARPREAVARRQFVYVGLPTITYVSNGDGRLTEVTMAGQPIVSYDWSDAPYAVTVRFCNRWSVITAVLPDGSATQQVVDSTGAQRAFGSVLVHAHEFSRPAVVLDALATELGLADQWQAGVTLTSADDVRLLANGKAISIRYHGVGAARGSQRLTGRPSSGTLTCHSASQSGSARWFRPASL